MLLIVFLLFIESIAAFYLGEKKIAFILSGLQFFISLLLIRDLYSVKKICQTFDLKNQKRLISACVYTSLGEAIRSLLDLVRFKITTLANSIEDLQKIQSIQTDNEKMICEVTTEKKFYQLLSDFALEHSRAKATACLIFNHDNIAQYVSGNQSDRFRKMIERTVRTNSFCNKPFDLVVYDANNFNSFGFSNVVYVELNWKSGDNFRKGLLAFFYSTDTIITLGEEEVIKEIRKKIELELSARSMLLFLGQRVEEVENINRNKEDVIRYVSHDLRSPLNNIKAALTLLKTENLSEETQNLINIGQKNCNAVIELADEILDFARLSRDDVEVDCKEINLSQFVFDIVSEFEVFATMKGISLFCDVPKQNTPLYVFADPRHLRKIVSNLLSNAIKYTVAGSVKVSCYNSEKPQLIIEDTGVGMSSEQLYELGKPFSRFHPHITNGAGLGVALVKKLAHLNNAKIEYSSTINVGTTATISFLAPIKENVNIHPKKDIKKILIVDDDPDCVVTLGRFLEKYGYTVFNTVDVEQALILLADERPDLLLTDLNMSNGGGKRLIEFVSEKRLNTKVFIISGESKEDFLSYYPSLNVDGFYTKPVDFSLLLEALSK